MRTRSGRPRRRPAPGGGPAGERLLVVVRLAGPPAAALDGRRASAKITAIGAENEYADVIAQVGGKYVQAASIMSNPNTDPHTFEASPAVAREITAAQLVVQNGVGYDDWATTIENADPSDSRKVINVQQLLGLPDSTPNPHLWYKPATMPAVASAIAADLGADRPGARRLLQGQRRHVHRQPGRVEPGAIAAFKSAHPGTPVATTEPVADYMLQAAGADNLTPVGVPGRHHERHRPLAAGRGAQKSLFTQHKVKVFLYNQQVTDSLTESFIKLANENGIPVVGVYETMPTPGYDYQSWMLAEVNALNKAVTGKVSTEQALSPGTGRTRSPERRGARGGTAPLGTERVLVSTK